MSPPAPPYAAVKSKSWPVVGYPAITYYKESQSKLHRGRFSFTSFEMVFPCSFSRRAMTLHCRDSKLKGRVPDPWNLQNSTTDWCLKPASTSLRRAFL